MHLSTRVIYVPPPPARGRHDESGSPGEIPPSLVGIAPAPMHRTGKDVSVVAEKQTRQFNPTLGSSHEDFLKNRELAGGFSTRRAIWRDTCGETAYTHQGDSSEVLGLLVSATEGSEVVSNRDVSVVALSH